MADINGFTDHETIYFKMGADGELYIVPPDPMGLDRGVLGHAVIESVDVETNTIWFTSPLPASVMKAKCR